MLHLFSGHRREGDLQHVLEGLSTARTFYVISIDIICDPILGDLTRQDVRAVWLKATASGEVVAVIAGPPCETWSAARFFPTLPNRDAAPPRPLRSLEAPWGRDNLTGRERQQVDLANHLLRATVVFMTLAHAAGVSGLMEHPAPAHWVAAAPSSWRLPEVQRLGAMPHSRMVRIDQCCFGALSKKPTTLLCIHLETLPAALARMDNRGLCNHPGGHTTAIGRTATEDWRTSALKTYPRALCDLIAKAIRDKWSHLPPTPVDDDLADIPDHYLRFHQPLDPYTDGGTWGQDCSFFNRTEYQDDCPTDEECFDPDARDELSDAGASSIDSDQCGLCENALDTWSCVDDTALP